MPHRGYDECAGPPRDPTHSLETWHGAADKADAVREAGETRARKVLPDLYDVADTVLAPLMAARPRAVPRRLGTAVRDALEARGEKPTRENLLLEAARFLAQEKAAADPELAVALLLRAALLFRPAGGWSSQAPRAKSREGFGSLAALLGAAFSEVSLGIAAIPLEIAQNRARTRSHAGEVFVHATHSGTSRPRNVDGVERRTDAQALLYRSRVDLALLPLLFERHVLGRYRGRRELLDELRYREGRRRRVSVTLVNEADPADVRRETVSLALTPQWPAQPSRWGKTLVGRRGDGSFIVVPMDPPSRTPEAELAHAAEEEARWRAAVGVLLWGVHPKQEAHIQKCDRALVRPVGEAEEMLCAAIGLPLRQRLKTRGSPVLAAADVEPATPSSDAEVLVGD